jgi:hypothetical protein
MNQYKKVAFYTLGCKLNFSETSTISRLFEDSGYAKVDFEETPDIYVVNTCSVTENADKKCKQLVKRGESTNTDEMQMLRFIKSRHIVTEDDVETCGGDRFLVRKLKREGYVRELSNGG